MKKSISFHHCREDFAEKKYINFLFFHLGIAQKIDFSIRSHL
ncbi:unknown protein [Parachlamydia acanthamoebae UV-7]|uniref:Uncharacterized protein n=2 Tax=Parachlamydia acanthamoebae TaxID=83552 RepID=F8KWV9_PARAV|nr:hypothetical protein DB43_FU00180 [Parachlamydia acanthamoebae]CCB86543.1 unknown protein [Parachlamydia acanthamoebae UV-7]